MFVGTRVPVRSLFDHLEAGDSIDDFLEGFPSVRREQVIAVLEASRKEAVKLTKAAMDALKPLGRKAVRLEEIAAYLLLREY